MKTHMKLFALSAATLALGLTSVTAQSVESVDTVKNRAVAASPRAQEAFPWLTRASAPAAAPDACCQPACCSEGASEVASVTKNRAIAASPRFLEVHPELTRTTPAPAGFTVAPLVENKAVQANPRTQEEFPGISRGAASGSAKGGASRLMEPRR